jgi:hypothetical protein
LDWGVLGMQSYVRASSVVSRVIAGETLIVPVRGGVGDLASIYSLNPVGSSIWNAIAQPCSEDKIIAHITEEFSGEGQQVEQDVKSFLAEMRSAGLVETVGAAA